MWVVRSEQRQESGPESALPRSAVAEGLSTALEEIAKIEHELRSRGDAATLERFGDAEDGAVLAESLGFEHVSVEEAHTVDQLSWMPDGMNLVRAYLRAARAPD